MNEKFDYAKAIAELEAIAAKVENPETKLDDIDALVGRSKELLKKKGIDFSDDEVEQLVKQISAQIEE